MAFGRKYKANSLTNVGDLVSICPETIIRGRSKLRKGADENL